MAHTEQMPTPEGGQEYREASREELENKGWTLETIRQAAAELKAMAEDGFARIFAPRATEISPEGVKTDQEKRVSLLLALPDRTRRALAAGAAALTMGGAGAGMILSSPEAALAAEKPAIHELVTEPGKKMYPLPPGVEEFEVRLNGENTDIGDEDTNYEKTQKDGKIMYRVKQPDKVHALALDVSPSASSAVDVGVYTSRSTERDLQLFQNTSGEMKFLTGTGKAEQEGLASYALVESVLGGKEKTLGGVTEAWYMPLNVRALNNYPQSDTAGVGVSSGYAYVDKDTKWSAEAGGIYDPKVKKMLEGREGLVALSYAQKDGRFGINAELLSTIGSQGKGAAEITLDYATLPDRGEGHELTIGAGFGIRGAHIDTSPSKAGRYMPTEMRYATIPVSWKTPYGEITAGPEIDVDTGDVRVAGGMNIKTGRILEGGAQVVQAAGEKLKEFSETVSKWIGAEKDKKIVEKDKRIKELEEETKALKDKGGEKK